MTFTLTLVVLIYITNALNDNETCSSKDTTCPNEGLCDPNNDKCVGYNATYHCGKYGDFLNCSHTGIVIGECGSGEHDDCTDYSKNLCPNDNDIYEGIECNYAGLGTPTNITKWVCGKYGTELSCLNYGGGALIGVCGAGRREDCQKYCDGYHAILCASSDFVPINWGKCKWLKATKGEWIYCPEGYIAAGHCGSGMNANCGFEVYHELQCCPPLYS